MKAKILCIDDEDLVRDLIVSELTDAGYDAIAAEDGVSGLSAILKQRPDLVLCDITMPSMDGPTVLSELRSNYHEFAEVPFIFLTGLGDRENVLEGMRRGADDYLTKPIDFDLLFATIDARLTQVQRMLSRKEEQLVKLYRSMQHPILGGEKSSRERTSAAITSMSSVQGLREKLSAQCSSRGGQLVAGRLQMIGLEKIKEELGDAWPRHSDRIRRMAGQIIQGYLVPQDVVHEEDDVGFVICFATLSEDEAAFKAKAIALEIQEKLLGSRESLELTSDIPPELLSKALEIRTDALTMELSADALDTSPSVESMIAERLKSAGMRIQENIPNLIRELDESFTFEKIAAFKPDGGETSFQFAAADLGSQTKINRILNASMEPEKVSCDIDVIRLGTIAEHLCENLHPTGKLTFVPVSYHTLVLPKYRNKYLGVCQAVPEIVRSRIGFKIEDFPDSIHEGRLIDVARHLTRFSSCQMLNLDLAKVLQINLAQVGSVLISVPYTSVLSYAYSARATSTGREKLRLARLIVTDVPDRERLKILKQFRISAYTVRDERAGSEKVGIFV